MLLSAIFGFQSSSGSLYRAHWVGLTVTFIGLSLTAASLAWRAAGRRGYGPAVLVISTAPLLLASPAVALLEDFGMLNRQLSVLKQQVLVLTIGGQVALFSAVGWNASLDRALPRRLTKCWLFLTCSQRSGIGSTNQAETEMLLADQAGMKCEHGDC